MFDGPGDSRKSLGEVARALIAADVTYKEQVHGLSVGEEGEHKGQEGQLMQWHVWEFVTFGIAAGCQAFL